MNVVKSMSHLQSSKNFCFKTIKQSEAKMGHKEKPILLPPLSSGE